MDCSPLMAKKKSSARKISDQIVEDVEKQLTAKKPAKLKFSKQDMLSSGSTLVNLACTGRIIGSFVKGTYSYFVGDSDSGKTWFCMSVLAEAARNANFEDYDLIYNNVENGAMMDIPRFFGQKLADRMIELNIEYIEDMYFELYRRLKPKKNGDPPRPFIFINDSMDALRSRQDEKKTEKNARHAAAGRELEGAMTDGKAKANSQHLRRVCSMLQRTGSIFIVISQTRDNMNSMGRGDGKTHAGGRALKFYCTHQIWTSVREHIQKDVLKKKRELGIKTTIKIKRNRITGRNRTVTVPIYHSYGIDDVGANIDYLVEEGHWSKGTINAEEFGVKMKRDKLIKHIENNGLERELRVLVGKVWNEIEAACAVKRKPRYE